MNGFLIEKSQRYVDAAIFGVNAFSYGDLDYYGISIAVSFPRFLLRSGAVNLVTDRFRRLLPIEDLLNCYKISVRITDEETSAVGQ